MSEPAYLEKKGEPGHVNALDLEDTSSVDAFTELVAEGECSICLNILTLQQGADTHRVI